MTPNLQIPLRKALSRHEGVTQVQFTQVDETLAIAASFVAAEGRMWFYAISQRNECTRIVVVRDGAAFDTVTLQPHEINDTTQGQFLVGSSLCLLQHDVSTSGRIHAVCEGQLVLDADVSYVQPFAGHIDKITHEKITGWAIDLRKPQDEVKVDLLIDGIVYTSRPTTTKRPDIEAIYPDRLLSGFEFNVQIDALPIKNMSIGARISESNFTLKSRKTQYSQPAYSHRSPSSTQVQFQPRYVSIVIPVYNAPQELRDCLDSLLTHTIIGPNRHRIILSDDASPDPNVGHVLDEYKDKDGITILRHRINLGYTKNINSAILKAQEIAPDGDIVLLNSDTRVTPQWLELLQRCAMQRPSIGTVSAVSDNAGAFSVPIRNTINPVPPWMSEDDHARLVTHVSTFAHLRVPTTSGFCMYIRHNVFSDIGLFDEENFPRGYGEENDFCMRAGHVGWEHVVADNVIIYHERSASFLGNKTALMERASDLIPRMYPEYGRAVYQAFNQSPEINRARFIISHARLRHPVLPRPRIAFVIGVESGGTPQTNMDLMASIQTEYEPYLILCTTTAIRIFQITGNERREVEKIGLHHRVTPISHDSDSYRTSIADVLQRYAFELVHIRHIGRHGLSLIRTAKDLSIPVIFSLHDFYTVCPNVKLLDAENRYCAGRCTPGGRDCNVELWDQRNTPPLKNAWVRSWQKIFQNILPVCDALVTTSPYARDLVSSIYDLKDTPFKVIPHARDFESFSQMAAPLAPDEPLRVLVPGHIVPAKGLDLIKSIKEIDTENRIEFHFAGMSKIDLTPYGISHGPYERSAFDRLVRDISPHIGAVLSIWPETYSHTLTELWSCGIPVVTSSYGATGERVAQHGGGWALEDMEPAAVLTFLLQLASNPSEIDARSAEVADWQTGYGQDYSIAIMAEQYKRLYRQTLRRAAGREEEAIVLPLGGRTDIFEPVTHLRDLLKVNGAVPHIMVWPAPALHMLKEIGAPDYLIVRYHAEPSSLHDWCAELIATRTANPDMILVLELAPDALSLPLAENALETRPTLSWLLANSNTVIGPTELIKGASLPEELDLTTMLLDPKDTNHLPQNTSTPTAAVLPADSNNVMPHIAERMDTEVVNGGSACIFRHNASLVSANFTLIDWNAMLSRPRRPGLVSLVMPTFNRVALTETFLRSILSITDTTTDYEIIIIDNGSKTEAKLQIEALADLSSRVKVVSANVPLMFSVGCNYGASFASGEYLVFVNNDMEAISPDWLDKLVAPLKNQPHIGITGGRLLFGDRTVQHAGLVFSDRTSMAYHAYLGAASDAPHVNKERLMQAVTGACMAMRATDWAKLRGFNPLYLNGCEDVDLCLRMKQVLARETLYVPNSLLLHHEGKSPGRGRFILANRWIFDRIWGNTLRPDDQATYQEDGFRSAKYTAKNTWLAPQYRTVEVELVP